MLERYHVKRTPFLSQCVQVIVQLQFKAISKKALVDSHGYASP